MVADARICYPESMSAGPLPVVGALVWRQKTVLLQRRGPGSRHPGALELPGGKIEPGEGPVAALERELGEEWGLGARGLRIGPVADVLHHVYGDGLQVLLIVYHVDAGPLDAVARGEGLAHLRPVDGATIEPYGQFEIPLDEVLDADRPLLERVMTGAVKSPF